MHLEKLSIINFKNYEEIAVDLHPKLNCFVGNNGVGKTNLLDSVYYLCMCKSYFQSSDKYTIRYDQDFMVIQGVVNKGDAHDELYCAIKTGKRKQFRKNKKEYQRLSDHIGLYPVVMVSPSDSTLILEGSEQRRKYLNAVISQFDREYLENTINYNKILLQRNKLLKDAGRSSSIKDLLDIYDQQLIPLGTSIYEKRKLFVSELSEVFNKFYALISGGNEKVELEYLSQLNQEDMASLLVKSREKDRILQSTSAGIHKDDLGLLMNAIPIKKIGSQGQQKTFLVSLKMAQFEFLKHVKKIKPLLLLDDIFDKFDANRVQEILRLVAEDAFGQIFITHTNKERMLNLLEGFKDAYYLYNVNEGAVKLVNS